MKLDIGGVDGKQFYESNVWVQNKDYLLLEWYSTLREAKQAIRNFLKTYNGDKKELDCFVKHFDEYGCNDEDFEI